MSHPIFMSDLMPIHSTASRIPMRILNENQAQRNHAQSLKRLAERGGVCWSEALALVERRPWRKMDEIASRELVLEAIRRAGLGWGVSEDQETWTRPGGRQLTAVNFPPSGCIECELKYSCSDGTGMYCTPKERRDSRRIVWIHKECQ